jgi:hypothetical protein
MNDPMREAFEKWWDGYRPKQDTWGPAYHQALEIDCHNAWQASRASLLQAVDDKEFREKLASVIATGDYDNRKKDWLDHSDYARADAVIKFLKRHMEGNKQNSVKAESGDGVGRHGQQGESVVPSHVPPQRGEPHAAGDICIWTGEKWEKWYCYPDELIRDLSEFLVWKKEKYSKPPYAANKDDGAISALCGMCGLDHNGACKL